LPSKFSDKRENLKSLREIMQKCPDKLFLFQKSTISIFRYEDVLFAIYPHLAAHRRRGTSSKEVFQQMDP
jgi:hypothetical protein